MDVVPPVAAHHVFPAVVVFGDQGLVGGDEITCLVGPALATEIAGDVEIVAACRTQYVFLDEVLVGLPGDFLDYEGKDEVAEIGIALRCTGQEIQRASQDNLHKGPAVRWGFQPVLDDYVFGGEHRIASPGGESSLVAEQVFHGDLEIVPVLDGRGVETV